MKNHDFSTEPWKQNGYKSTLFSRDGGGGDSGASGGVGVNNLSVSPVSKTLCL